MAFNNLLSIIDVEISDKQPVIKDIHGNILKVVSGCIIDPAVEKMLSIVRQEYET